MAEGASGPAGQLCVPGCLPRQHAAGQICSLAAPLLSGGRCTAAWTREGKWWGEVLVLTWLAVADVFSNGCGKQRRLLAHKAHLGAQEAQLQAHRKAEGGGAEAQASHHRAHSSFTRAAESCWCEGRSREESTAGGACA